MSPSRLPCACGLALLVGLVLCGCADRSAGGTGVETTNGVFALIVRDSSGAIVEGALVRLRPADWKPGDALPLDASRLQASTDSSGRAVFQPLPAGLWRGEAIHLGRASQILDTSRPGDRSRSATLAKTGSVRGKAPAGSIVATIGLEHSTRTDSAGAWRLDSIPAGTLDIRCLSNGARVFVRLDAGASVTAPSLTADPQGSTLLDDFQDGDSRHRFGLPIGSGWWYVSAGTGMSIAPEGAREHPDRAVAADSASGARWLSVSTVDDSATWPWMEIGVNLGDADLSQVGTIVAKMRGDVAVNVSIRVFDGDSVVAWSGVQVKPNATWNDFRIPVFALRHGGNAAVESTYRHSTAIAFQTAQAGTLAIDDLRLEGAPPWRIWPGLVMP